MILKVIQYILWICLGSTLPLVYGMHLTMTRKKTRLSNICNVLTLAAWIIFGFVIICNDLQKKGYGPCMIIFLVLNILICYEEKLLYKIMVLFVIMIVTLIGDVSVNFIIRFFGDVMWVGTEVSIRNTLLIFLFAIIALTLLKLVSIPINKTKSKELKFDRSVLLFFLIPVGQYLMTCAFLSRSYIDKVMFDRFLNKPMFVSGIGISFIADLLLFWALLENSRAHDDKIKLTKLEYENKMSQSYYDNVCRNTEQIMKYKHDFNNILGTAYHLICSGDTESNQKGIELLDELYERNEDMSMSWYCSNPVVNMVIVDKMRSAEELGVDFETDISIPKEIDVALADICSIYTNLIDNAFKNASCAKCRKVELSSSYDMGMMFVKIKNYPDTVPELLSHQKSDLKGKLKEHGYGLDILKDIADKYSGEIKIHTSENTVEVLVAVKC